MKKFKTIVELKEHLIKNKNIRNDNVIIDILQERAYASIINPYKKFFFTKIIDEIHEYEEEVSIIDYYDLSSIDDLISKELHYYIGIFERRVKGAFAHVISEKMKSIGDNSCTNYIEVFSDIENRLSEFNNMGFNNYDMTYNRAEKTLKKASDKTIDYRKNLLQNISNVNDSNKRKNKLFNKYLINNIKIPFWLVVHTLSIGELLSVYEMLGKDMRNKILSFLNNSVSTFIFADTLFKFEDDLRIIKELRNIINHYEPLYEFVRETPKTRLLKGINRVLIYSEKVSIKSLETLLNEIPTFKNKTNDQYLDIYKFIIEEIKKRDA